jgi:ABC-type uncharacterized transport system permease subunit
VLQVLAPETKTCFPAAYADRTTAIVDWPAAVLPLIAHLAGSFVAQLGIVVRVPFELNRNTPLGIEMMVLIVPLLAADALAIEFELRLENAPSEMIKDMTAYLLSADARGRNS